MKINQALGKFLHAYREDNKLTLDQIATATCEYGTGWNTSVISQFESGKRSASLPNMIVILQALSDLSGEKLTLADIFYNLDVIEDIDDPEPVHIDITDNLAIDSKKLANMLGGSAVDIKPIPPFGTPEHQKYIDDMFSEAEDSMREYAKKPPVSIKLPDGTHRFMPSFGHSAPGFISPTLAEKRAAQKLGMPPSYFIDWCYLLYGCRLSEEIDKRVDADASPQKKGRVTREIIEVIQALITERTEWMALDAANGDL